MLFPVIYPSLTLFFKYSLSKMQRFWQLPGHGDAVKSDWAARTEAVSSSMREDRTLVSLIESRPFGSTCWLLWCTISISDRVESKKRGRGQLPGLWFLGWGWSPRIVHLFSKDRRVKSQNGRRKGETKPHTEYMYLKALKDVLKPLFMTWGRAESLTSGYLFCACRALQTENCLELMGWESPLRDINGLSSWGRRKLQTNQFPLPAKDFLPLAHLTTEKEN